MKQVKGYRIWQIVYPIGIYYVISSLVYYALELVFDDNQETYMIRQLICAACTIPVEYSFYRQDKNIEDTVYENHRFQWDKKTLTAVLLSVVGTASLGIAVNNVIAMTPLMEVSDGFAEANESFFGGAVIFELLGSCLVIPIAEELLFRGVVYKRLKLFSTATPAIFFSALIFGAVHFNIVQFLYAGILGIFLALLLERTGFLFAAVLGHMAANMVAVIRAETGWLDFAYEPTAAGISVTVLAFAVALAAIYKVHAFSAK